MKLASTISPFREKASAETLKQPFGGHAADAMAGQLKCHVRNKHIDIYVHICLQATEKLSLKQ